VREFRNSFACIETTFFIDSQPLPHPPSYIAPLCAMAFKKLVDPLIEERDDLVIKYARLWKWMDKRRDVRISWKKMEIETRMAIHWLLWESRISFQFDHKIIEIGNYRTF
jgi:hypothetical protein